ncbi:MAG: hypothetical protein K0S65_3961 [Labilithrix sp.]|nr:hypothetical protein [Labilithrix sp.]
MKTSLLARYVLPAGLFGAATALACSEDGMKPPPDAPPPADAGSDVVEADVLPDADCATCRWFPADCSRGALCSVNVTVDPNDVLLALGTHEQGATAVGTHGAVVDLAGGAWRNGSVGTNDALRAIATHGGELWAASSLDAVFVRSLGDGGTDWTHLSTRGDDYFSQHRPINGLFGDPRRTWAWAAVTPVCAGGFFGNGVALVRLRREPTRLAVENVITHDGFVSRCAGLNAIDGTGDAIWAVGDLGAVYELTDLESATPRIVPTNSGTTLPLRAVWENRAPLGIGRERNAGSSYSRPGLHRRGRADDGNASRRPRNVGVGRVGGRRERHRAAFRRHRMVTRAGRRARRSASHAACHRSRRARPRVGRW